MCIRLVFFLLFPLVLGDEVNANEDAQYPEYLSSSSMPALITSATLDVSDGVTDNCWTNSEVVKSKIYLLLEQNEIFVPDYDVAFYNPQTVSILLSAFGFRTGSGVCAVSAEFSVDTKIYQSWGGGGGKQEYSIPYVASIYSRASVFTNSANVNDQILNLFDGAASEFAAKVISARRSPEIRQYRSQYPVSNERPISKQKWDELFSSVDSQKN